MYTHTLLLVDDSSTTEQEIRSALAGEEFPERTHYWQSGEHELDFVVDRRRLIEVKRGRTSALEYAWFPKVFPSATLQVLGRDRFETGSIRGTTIEDFLLEVP